MEPRFVVWSPYLGQTEEIGSTKITSVFFDERDAAIKWAREMDLKLSRYMMLADTHRVTVRDCLTGDITEWEVCGEFEPAYFAHDITRFRKEPVK